MQRVETVEVQLNSLRNEFNSLRNELSTFMLNQDDENRAVREQIAHLFTLLASANFQHTPPTPPHTIHDPPSPYVVQAATSGKRDEFEGVERRV